MNLSKEIGSGGAAIRENAASVASMILTAQSLITTKEEAEPEHAGHSHGGGF